MSSSTVAFKNAVWMSNCLICPCCACLVLPRRVTLAHHYRLLQRLSWQLRLSWLSLHRFTSRPQRQLCVFVGIVLVFHVAFYVACISGTHFDFHFNVVIHFCILVIWRERLIFRIIRNWSGRGRGRSSWRTKIFLDYEDAAVAVDTLKLRERLEAYG